MKKILLISSEHLFPESRIGSVFELAQAKILRDSYQVAILSVRSNGSSAYLLKRVISLLVRLKLNHELFIFSMQLLQSLLRFRGYIKHMIDDIPVYEGFDSNLRSPAGFGEGLKNWTEAGLRAFMFYKEENGLPDLVHAHGRFLNAGWLAFRIEASFKIPYIYTEHSTYYQSGHAPVESKEFLEKIIENASHFICVSLTLKKSVELFLGQSIERAVIIPNALGLDFEEAIIERPTISNPIHFLSIGSLVHKKGIDVLIKSFARAFSGSDHFRLTIVGEGPSFGELLKLTKELEVQSKVLFVGNQNPDEIVRILDRSSVFVLASRIETFGVVVIEALSRGLPAVVTRCGGPEFLINKDNGIVVAPDDVESLCQTLLWICSNLNFYNREGIRRDALMNYGSVAFLRKMKSVYEEVWS